jgi:rhodanese-related sulfurtransferase
MEKSMAEILSGLNQESSEPSSTHPKTPKRGLLWLWFGLGAVVVVVAGVLLVNLQPTPQLGIPPAQALAKIRQGAFVLDVRTQPEWDQFHITGSILVPLEQLQNRLDELPKYKNIVVVCLTGVRSKSGAAILQKAGFTHLSYVVGGLQAWMAAGYPVQGNTP